MPEECAAHRCRDDAGVALITATRCHDGDALVAQDGYRALVHLRVAAAPCAVDTVAAPVDTLSRSRERLRSRRAGREWVQHDTTGTVLQRGSH
jgi:hypothetical protein